jgi:hypothetical protein
MLRGQRAFVLLMREGSYRLLSATGGIRSWTVVHRWPVAR